MTIAEKLLLVCKDNVVELTSTVEEPHLDPADFENALADLLDDHQYQVMTDATILDPQDLGVATCIISRSQLPSSTRDTLQSFSFSPVDSDDGGREKQSMFSRFQSGRRTKLDKWRMMYGRAHELGKELASLEERASDVAQLGNLADTVEAGTDIFVQWAEECLRRSIKPNLKSLTQIESAILSSLNSTRKRLVFHPKLIAAITGFTAAVVMNEDSSATWSPEANEDSPLQLQASSGDIIESDPEFRAICFVRNKSNALLSEYVESLLAQKNE